MADPKPGFEEQLARLRDDFRGKLEGRLDELDAAFAGIGDGADARRPLEDLMALAHKLAGSAGTFGYGALGDAAGRLETALEALLAGADGRLAGGRAEIAGLLGALRAEAAKGPD